MLLRQEKSVCSMSVLRVDLTVYIRMYTREVILSIWVETEIVLSQHHMQLLQYRSNDTLARFLLHTADAVMAVLAENDASGMWRLQQQEKIR